MRNCWVQSIRVRWFKPRLFKSSWFKHLSIALAALAMWCLWASAATEPLSDLKAGVEAYQGKRYPAAIAALGSLAKRLPQLADYSDWFLASAEFDTQDFSRVPKTLEPVWKRTPLSPLAGRSLLLAAKADLQGPDTNGKSALNLLRSNYAVLPQPQGDLGLASAFAASGDPVSAAIYFQRVY